MIMTYSDKKMPNPDETPYLTIKGNVGKQDSVTYKDGVGAKSGKPWQMLRFSMRDYATQDWVTCIAWGTLATEHSDLTAGSKVAVTGKWEERIYKEKLYKDFVCSEIEVTSRPMVEKPEPYQKSAQAKLDLDDGDGENFL